MTRQEAGGPQLSDDPLRILRLDDMILPGLSAEMRPQHQLCSTRGIGTHLLVWNGSIVLAEDDTEEEAVALVLQARASTLRQRVVACVRRPLWRGQLAARRWWASVTSVCTSTSAPPTLFTTTGVQNCAPPADLPERRGSIGEAKYGFGCRFDKKYWATYKVLDILQKVFYRSNPAREAFVEMCESDYVQKMTFDSYLYKTVRAYLTEVMTTQLSYPD